jgi:hypothetical protein
MIDHRLKRRSDLVVVHPVLREAMRSQVVRRLVPAIERFFQFKATRLDRYIVSCYDSAVGGHFHRHRDNDNVGAQHRRFAVTINLNQDLRGRRSRIPGVRAPTPPCSHGRSGRVLVRRLAPGRAY